MHRGSPAVMMGPNEDPYIYRLLFDDDYNVAQQKQLNKIIRRMRKDIEFFRNESIEIDKYQRVKLSTLQNLMLECNIDSKRVLESYMKEMWFPKVLKKNKIIMKIETKYEEYEKSLKLKDQSRPSYIRSHDGDYQFKFLEDAQF